jgi:hypothetical protein
MSHAASALTHILLAIRTHLAYIYALGESASTRFRAASCPYHLGRSKENR